MLAQELNVGDWVRCEYHGKPRFGQVEEKMYGRYALQEGWLVKTQDGFRHFKLRKMHNVERVR